MQHSARRSTVLAAAIASALAAAGAGAQSASELPEVVVTARQRAEHIEDVPATVQAFTEARDRLGRHRAAAGLHRPDAERLAGADGGGRRHAGRDPRHQHRPRRGDELRAGRRRRAADEPERAQPGTQRRHADRGAEGPAGRGLRPQRPRRRDHHDDAQARRRAGVRGRRRLRQRQQLQGRPVPQRPDRRHAAAAASRSTRAAPTGSGTTRCSAATTAWITSRSPARSAA